RRKAQHNFAEGGNQRSHLDKLYESAPRYRDTENLRQIGECVASAFEACRINVQRALERMIDVGYRHQQGRDRQNQHHDLNEMEAEIGSAEQAGRDDGKRATENEDEPKNTREVSIHLQLSQAPEFGHFPKLR